MPGGITGLTCSWGKLIQENEPPGWGMSKIKSIKYAHESCGTQLRKAALAMSSKKKQKKTENYRLDFSSERAPTSLNP
jgi:hypothetical protein